MPRLPRSESSTGIYHIILRSVNQQIIFEEEADYREFLSVLQYSKTKYGLDIYAYCLMSNHVHLLMSVPDGALGLWMKSLGSIFVRWYNRKYQRVGYLFQDRFLSKPVENVYYFLNCLYYIHENPVNANMCRYATEYRWSSCSAYYGTKNELVDTKIACSMAGSKELLMDFFKRGRNPNEDDDFVFDEVEFEMYCPGQKLSGDKALAVYRQITGGATPADIQKMPKVERNNLIRKLLKEQLTYEQISLFCGVSKTTIARIRRNENM